MGLVSKEERMEKVVRDVASCRRCRLCESRKNQVPGKGDPDSPVVFVGEAPGSKEDEQGEPFVGSAGKRLDTLLEHIGLQRGDVYITNVLKCRPPKNRRPKSSEIRECAPHLEEQLGIIEPRIIAPMGNSAIGYIMRRYGLKRESIGKVHGRALRAEASWGRIKILPFYHPAAALYNQKLYKMLEEDFETLKGLLDRDEGPIG